MFIDLHGYDDLPVQPGQALDALLRALGVPAAHIPPSTEERGGFYRSALTQISEPVLVIADNASSEAQVQPLLPGTGPHRVLVTSRHTLAGLGARLVDLRVLDEGDAISMLDAALRASRPADDRIAAVPVGLPSPSTARPVTVTVKPVPSAISAWPCKRPGMLNRPSTHTVSP